MYFGVYNFFWILFCRNKPAVNHWTASQQCLCHICALFYLFVFTVSWPVLSVFGPAKKEKLILFFAFL